MKLVRSIPRSPQQRHKARTWRTVCVCGPLLLAVWHFNWNEVFAIVGAILAVGYVVSMWAMVCGYVRYFGWRRVFPTFSRLVAMGDEP